MSRANLTYGFEAEFLNLDKIGKIRNLAGTVLSPEDEVGVDGHNETIEVRTQPSTSVVEQFSRIGSAVRKYKTVLECNNPKLLEGKPLRGGAYYKTPLSIHLHFGNFDNSLIYPMVLLLQNTLDTNFIAKIDNQPERNARLSSGYGLPDLANCIRVKGDRWWEWRQPSSVFVPVCVKALLGASEILAQFLHQAPEKTLNSLRKTLRVTSKKSLTFSNFLEAYDITDTDTEANPFEIETLLRDIVQLGPMDWRKDLLPCWISNEE